MKKLFAFVTAFFLLTLFSASAQMFTTDPSPVQNSTKNVKIIFDAKKSGVAGLQGLSGSLYAHIGVSTDKKSDTWAYTPTTWNKNSAANEFKQTGADLYTLTIEDMHTYFSVPADEKITRICVIARKATANNNQTDQTSDQFIDVVADGFAMTFDHDKDATVISNPTKFTFTLAVTQTANLDIKVNGTSIATAQGTKLVKDYTFTSKGSYKVEATANNGSETLTQTINILYIAPSPQANYPGGIPKMGPVVNADGSVTFCLAAPNKSTVMIVGSWDNYATLDSRVMNYQDYNGCRYFWTTINGLDPNTDYMYYFNVDGTINVGDPYARLNLDCYSDKWLPTDVFPNRPKYPYALFEDRQVAVHRSNFAPYQWRVKNFKIPQHDQLIVYEMLLRDFTGTDGQAAGNGTIAKAIEKIPYLKQLGVNAVEVMPVMEFNGNNSWGYNTNFYFALDKAYGSPEEFKQFVDLCHGSGIAVILDIVFNHSDGLHPWYQMYPVASNPFYNAVAPHSWGVLNDWKQENPVVQQQFKDVLQFWMREYNVDGYRFDLVKGLGTQYGSTDGYNASRIPVMKAFHDAIKQVKPDGIHINEFLGDYKEEIEYANDGQIGWNNQNGNAQSWAKGAGTPNLNYFSAVNCSRPWGGVISYLESHDEERIAYVAKTYGSANVKNNLTFNMQNLSSLAAQLLMTPGPQMIWQFGELGADQTTKNSDGNNTDPKTVVWNYLDNDVRAGLMNNYKELIWLRRDNPELFSKNTSATLNFSGSVQRQAQLVSGNKEAVILINPSQSARNISFTPRVMNVGAYQVISHSLGTPKPVLTANGSQLTASIPPRCYAVFASNAVAGVDDIIADSTTQTEVYGEQGEIIITGNYNNAEVYNLGGQRQASLNVPAGVYIVRIDGVAHKVVVK